MHRDDKSVGLTYDGALRLVIGFGILCRIGGGRRRSADNETQESVELK